MLWIVDSSLTWKIWGKTPQQSALAYTHVIHEKTGLVFNFLVCP